MTRAQALALLTQIIGELNNLKAGLLGQPAAPGPGNLGVCPVHNVPWKKYNFGLAHPPAVTGEKWCRKADLEV
jgi:hypothetical protein